MSDPILEQRARAQRLADGAKRAGYLLFLASIVLFFVGLATNLASGVIIAATVCLIAGCIVLAPAILLGYAVRGAEREDREKHGL